MAVDAPALAEASSPMPVKPRTTTELELHIGDKLDILKMEGCPTCVAEWGNGGGVQDGDEVWLLTTACLLMALLCFCGP